MLLQKVEAYQRSHTSDHCPSREQWHEAKAEAKAGAGAEAADRKRKAQDVRNRELANEKADLIQKHGKEAYIGVAL